MMLLKEFQIFDMGFGGSITCWKDSELYHDLMDLMMTEKNYELTYEKLGLLSKIKVEYCSIDKEKAQFTITFPLGNREGCL